jgi:predicted PurR-regulated permease PerM
MNLDPDSIRLMRALMIFVAVVVIMSVAADVLKPLALAVLFAFILAPPVQWGIRLGLPRVISVGLVLIVCFAILANITYVVGDQFASLANGVSTYQANIQNKLASLKPHKDSPINKVSKAIENIEKSLNSPEDSEIDDASPVRIVSDNANIAQLHSMLGPFHMMLAFAGIVLLLLVFLLLESEEISDRIVQMVGWGKIGITTKTLTQIGRVLSRYLATLALFNTGFGVVIGLGLWGLGLPSPALWGMLATVLRFVPYLGTILSFLAPEILAIAYFPGWLQPLLVVALFGVTELVANGIEPLVYGKTTGISPIAMLVAALFWTWLWGGLGLLLANALTVCLAVVGQSIPGLGFLGTILGHEVKVADDLRWYQRVLHRDQDGAIAVLEQALKTQPLERVCDEIIIPSLARAEQDLAQEFLDKRDVVFIWRVIRDWLDDLSDRDDFALSAPTPATSSHTEPVRNVLTAEARGQKFVGIAANGGADALILRMLNMLLKPSGVRLTIMAAAGSPLQISDKVDSLKAGLIVVSHLPPLGLTRTRYLIRKLRARHPDVLMVVGYWSPKADPAQVAEQLRSASAYHTALSLASARTMILERTAQGASTLAASQ